MSRTTSSAWVTTSENTLPGERRRSPAALRASVVPKHWPLQIRARQLSNFRHAGPQDSRLPPANSDGLYQSR